MFSDVMKRNQRIISQNVTMLLMVGVLWATLVSVASAQTHCDPQKVVTAEACAKCHVNEVSVWKQTPHFRTFAELSRRPKAKEICKNMGIRSPKRSEICIDCHYTTKMTNDKVRAMSGISCESCHGAAQDWVTVHNDYGGPTITKETETAAHQKQRWETAIANGMRNTRNLYQIARSCYGCHTVPNEELVNVGGHNTGSMDFELVRWSQGQVRHNFLRTGGTSNATSSIERLRVMYVVGLIADLEFSTRATAKATSKAQYGIEVANRAARAAMKLYELQQKINNPNVQAALQAFAAADLKANNPEQLVEIAEKISDAGSRFAASSDGSELSQVDSDLPDPSEYK